MNAISIYTMPGYLLASYLNSILQVSSVGDYEYRPFLTYPVAFAFDENSSPVQGQWNYYLVSQPVAARFARFTLVADNVYGIIDVRLHLDLTVPSPPSIVCTVANNQLNVSFTPSAFTGDQYNMVPLSSYTVTVFAYTNGVGIGMVIVNASSLSVNPFVFPSSQLSTGSTLVLVKMTAQNIMGNSADSNTCILNPLIASVQGDPSVRHSLPLPLPQPLLRHHHFSL